MARAWWLAGMAAVLALPVREATAQSVVQIVGHDVRDAAKDFAGVWTSPLRGGTKDYLIVAGVLGAAALASPLDDEVDRWAIRNRDRGVLDAIRPFRRGGDFYSLNKATPYVGALYVFAVATNNRRIRDGIFGCVAAYGANTTIRHQVLYRIIGRDRPEPNKNIDPGETPTPPAQQGDQYDFTVPSEGWGQHSFPGGHVATMATCASFLSHRFQMGAVEPVLTGLVAVMGVGRLADRGHWLSDQIVGTAFGFAVGREVAKRQLKRRAAEQARATGPGAPSGESSGGAPFLSTAFTGTRVGWQIQF